MTTTPNTSIRLFGNLHSLRLERGLSPTAETCLIQKVERPLLWLKSLICR
ncbi:hypothetical protein [Malonomonas rubra]|nr:hypothetical protein [Malonomonas rubra]